MPQLVEAFKKIVSDLAPPTELTVSQWADQFRFLSPESSAEPGKWSTDRAPYQRGIMDAFNDPDVDQIVVMSASQVGKTDIINNVVGYIITQDPAPILMVQPTIDIAKAYSKDRLAPMIRDTPSLSGLVSDPKSRDGDNQILHKIFPRGHITIGGANSPAGLASRPIRVAIFDEVDRYPASAGEEGDPITLGMKRTTTFWNRKTLMLSTPTEEEISRIYQGWLSSDQRRYWAKCVSCGASQVLEWANVKWDSDDDGGHKPETARLHCVKCGYGHIDHERIQMLDGGSWAAGAAPGRVAGFHLNELYSPWIRLEETVRNFLDAKHSRNREMLKVWVNTTLGEPFKDGGATVSTSNVHDKVEEYTAEVPENALVLTAGVDVQDDRLEVEVVGWGKGRESWGIRYDILHGDPSTEGLWNRLDELLRTTFKRSSGYMMPISCTCIDSGGHFTQSVYRYTVKREANHVHAVKGFGGERPFLSRGTRGNALKALLFPIGVDEGKSTLYANLKLNEPGPSYCHFPAGRGYDRDYFNQLTSEERLVKYYKGKPTFYWQKKRGQRRNEALDVRIYAMAALELLNVNFEKLENFIKTKDGSPNAVPVRRPIKKSSGFVRRS